MANVMLTVGLIVAYGYMCEAFFAWFSGDIYERYQAYNRAFGPYGWSYWLLMLSNILVPQALWSRRVRTNPVLLFIVALFDQRRHVAGAVRHRDRQPAPRLHAVALGDVLRRRSGTTRSSLGTIGLFFTLLFLFIRFLPMISMTEVRELVAEGESEPVTGPALPPVFARLADRPKP